MELHRVDSKTLAAVAVTMRHNAMHHPDAHMQSPLSLDEVLESRMIASPLRLYDCAPISDGGAALIVSAAGRIGDHPKQPIWIRGAGQGHAHMYLSQMTDITINEGTQISSRAAFEMAGLTPKDIDLFMPYDAFTIMVLMQLEDIGFAEPGKAAGLIESGDITLTGSLPCNPHGGLLSFGHPRRPGALFAHVEAVRQLRGEVPEGRKPRRDPEIALVQSMGGPNEASNCTIIYSRSKEDSDG
jgi:acetyl-CoA acetyltransferase